MKKFKYRKPVAMISIYEKDKSLMAIEAFGGLEKLMSRIGKTHLSLADIKNMKEIGQK